MRGNSKQLYVALGPAQPPPVALRLVVLQLRRIERGVHQRRGVRSGLCPRRAEGECPNVLAAVRVMPVVLGRDAQRHADRAAILQHEHHDTGARAEELVAVIETSDVLDIERDDTICPVAVRSINAVAADERPSPRIFHVRSLGTGPLSWYCRKFTYVTMTVPLAPDVVPVVPTKRVS